MLETTTGRPLLVLVADDCPDTTFSLAVLIRLWGHEPLVANDGPAAVEAALARKPDVVLLDIALPGLDGFEVARKLRSPPQTRRTQVWALTGHGAEADHLHCREAGFDRHLLKPFDPCDLRRLLDAVASGAELAPAW